MFQAEIHLHRANPGYIITRYYDRRNSEWKYQYNDSTQNLYYAGPYPDGNLNGSFDPIGASNGFWYNASRNLTDILDSYGRTFWRTFDTKGNLTHQETGEGQAKSWTYDSLNNLTSYTDPLGNITRYCYQPGFATLLTKIIEPDSAMNPVSPADCSATGYPTTTLNYYTGSSDVGRGQLSEVIDPNGVWTGFEYDAWGQLNKYSEGRYDSQVASQITVYSFQTTTDGGGRTRKSFGSDSAEGDNNYNAANDHTSSVCKFMAGSSAAATSGSPNLPCNAPSLPRPCASFSGAAYAPDGDLDLITIDYHPEDCATTSKQRTIDLTHDSLNRLTYAAITSNESGSNIVRDFSYAPNWLTGTHTRTGPDDVETFTQFDTANRIASLRRGPSTSPIMTAAYTYQPNSSLLGSITFGNGMVQSFLYDGMARPTQIKYVSGGQTVLQLNYTYTADDLPLTITESGTLSDSATVTYAYNAQRRLIHESRRLPDNTYVYYINYEYDRGGNRTKKREHNYLAQEIKRTDYTYDTSAASTYQSNNNRLMKYEVYYTLGGANTLLSTTWYYYTLGGNVERVVSNTAGTQQYSATRFRYAMNGRAATFAMGETWNWDGVSSCPTSPTNYAIPWAREFRYDSARARYLNRQLDTTQLMQGIIVAAAGGDTWTDFDGDTAYGDYTLSGSTATNVRSYEPGIAVVDPWVLTGPNSTDYFVTDHLGTTRGVTLPSNAGSAPADAVTYSAFGEKISGANHRFGYVGAHGYQAHSDLPFLHVGARYYDSLSGRFLQRDPIGIKGGLNIYAYVANAPSVWTDPSGHGGGKSKLRDGEAGYELGCMIMWHFGHKCCPELPLYPGDEELDRRYRDRNPPTPEPWHPPLSPPPEPPPFVGPPAPPPPTPNPGYSCFVEGTPVATAEGFTSIETLHVGEEVLSSLETVQYCNVVLSVKRALTHELVAIELEDEKIKVTPEHPFWVRGSGWVRAGDLDSYDVLESVKGNPVTILAIRRTVFADPVPIYNLSVDDEHIYYVGDHRVRVHNKPP